jgi:hypothetical protein
MVLATQNLLRRKGLIPSWEARLTFYDEVKNHFIRTELKEGKHSGTIDLLSSSDSIP